MPEKEIVCLAFSRKNGGNCFAGIELETGLWIRAIGGRAGGALSDFECYMQVGNDPYAVPKKLDVIKIGFIGPERSSVQPENWKISGTPWGRVRQANAADIDLLKRHITDDPEVFRGYEDRVPVEDIERRPPNYSLALVRPSSLRWQSKTGYHGRRQSRGTFAVSGVTYDLSLTDDDYAALLPQQGTGVTNGLSDRKVDMLLTISLGDAYHGNHYKLIAGVIRLPRNPI